MNILVLDNYDSFTYNLVQYIQEIISRPVDVYRNDAITLEDVDGYDVIFLSPGPGLPADAGIMSSLLKRYAASKAILGVCLGHQAIGEAFGATLENLEQVYHGVETPVHLTVKDELLFREVPPVFQGGRYHSWVVRAEDLPDCLEVTAVDSKGMIMALRHRRYNVRGVQFHPESVMTEYGIQILENFLTFCTNSASVTKVPA
jgi:anthranilate synthase component 2